jgi:transcriptional regulator with GAF, ATPase, and Fis domain
MNRDAGLGRVDVEESKPKKSKRTEELNPCHAAVGTRSGEGVTRDLDLSEQALRDWVKRDRTHRRLGALTDARDQFERKFIELALARAGGRRTRAARELGLSRQGLLKMMTRLAITK